MIFVLLLHFRRLIYFGLVGLDEHCRYMLILSFNLHGFMDFTMGFGLGLVMVCRDLARVGWNGFRSGTSLAEVKEQNVVDLVQFCFCLLYTILSMTCLIDLEKPQLGIVKSFVNGRDN